VVITHNHLIHLSAKKLSNAWRMCSKVVTQVSETDTKMVLNTSPSNLNMKFTKLKDHALSWKSAELTGKELSKPVELSMMNVRSLTGIKLILLGTRSLKSLETIFMMIVIIIIIPTTTTTTTLVVEEEDTNVHRNTLQLSSRLPPML